MAQASFGYFGVGVETTPGTAVAPTKFLPVKDVDFPIESNFIEIREIRGSRQAYSTFDGPVRPSINFTSSFYPSGAMGVILKGLFGSVATAASGASATAKAHTFGDAAVLPSLSFERSDARVFGQGVILERVNGCKIESVGFSCAYGEDVEVSVAAQGLGFPTSPGSKPATFTAYPAGDPFIFTGASITVGGTANNLFKSIDFEFTNTLERQEALRGTREAYKMYEGGLDCSLSGTMIFDDLTMYTNLKNATSFSLVVSFAGAQIASDGPGAINYGATFTFPKVKVSSFGIPMTAGEVMEADVEFEVQFDSATSKIVGVVLTNLDAVAAYDV
jgi:hypothetical protein